MNIKKSKFCVCIAENSYSLISVFVLSLKLTLDFKYYFRQDILCNIKYTNTLPDTPFILKSLKFPFTNNRLYEYHPTTLETTAQFECHTENDIDVEIDLIDQEKYGRVYPTANLHENDLALLEDEITTTIPRSAIHAKHVSWLRRSEYISSEKTRFQPKSADMIEAKVGYNLKKSLMEETIHMDRDAQIKNIETTFTESKIILKEHYRCSQLNYILKL